jgi:RecJ-like exonuclease
MENNVNCKDCDGTGVILLQLPLTECPVCKGTGWVLKKTKKKLVATNYKQAIKMDLQNFPDQPKVLGYHLEQSCELANFHGHEAFVKGLGNCHQAACMLTLCAKILHQVKCEYAKEISAKPPMELYNWIWPAAKTGSAEEKYKPQLDFAWAIYKQAKKILEEESK